MGKPAYTELAEIYDRVFGGQRAKVWQQARRRWLGRALPRLRSVCDLGCGTGTTALGYARHGCKVYAVDLSPAMCRVVRQKARQAGLAIRILQADMRTFRLPEPVDLVTSEFTVLNHAQTKADLRSVMRAVARALWPGGFFFFDVSHRAALERVWTGSWWVERRDLFIARRGGYDRKRDRGWVEVTWFARQRRGWDRHQARIEVVPWSKSEILRALRAAGFTRIEAHDLAPLIPVAPLNRRGNKTFFVAQKS